MNIQCKQPYERNKMEVQVRILGKVPYYVLLDSLYTCVYLW